MLRARVPVCSSISISSHIFHILYKYYILYNIPYIPYNYQDRTDGVENTHPQSLRQRRDNRRPIRC